MKLKQPPRIRGLPFLGSALKIARAGSSPKFHLYVDDNHKRLGPVYWDNLGSTEGYFVADPTAARKVFLAEGTYPQHVVPPSWLLYNKKFDCKRGLFFMDGEEWLKYRRIMNPIFFNKNLMETLRGVHEDITNQFIIDLRNFEGKEVHNLEHLLYKNSISFAVGHLLGNAYLKNKHLFQEDIISLGSITNTIFKSTAKLMNLPVTLAAWLNLNVWNDFVAAVQSSLVASRQLTNKMMTLDLTDGLLKELMRQNIQQDILESLILDLMLAAGDTTAFTTQWALYLLSKNPETIKALRKDTSLVRGIVRETLRLYPSAIFLSRVLHQDLNILDCTIPKGELVMISLYTIGRREDVYPEASKFKPERWNRGGEGMLAGVTEPMAYFPFALGARSCIGRKLAEAQMYQTLSKVLQNYNLELVEEVEMELQLVPVPSKPIRLRLMQV